MRVPGLTASLDKLGHLSEPLFPYLYHEDAILTPTKCLGRVTQTACVKCLPWRGVAQQAAASTESDSPQGTFPGQAHPPPAATGFCLEHCQLPGNLAVQLGCLYLLILYVPLRSPVQGAAHHRCSIRRQSKRGCPGGVVSTSGCLPESRGLGITLTGPWALPQACPSAP